MVKRARGFAVCVLSVTMSMAFALQASAADKEPVATRVTKSVPAERLVTGVTPESFFEQQARLHASLMAIVPAGSDKNPVRVELNDNDRNELATPAPAGPDPTPMRVGLVKSISPTVGILRGQPLRKQARQAAHDVMQQTADGGFVWATTITSPGAVAIRVHFTDVAIPDSAELYLLSPEGEAYGPYRGAGPDGSGDFWSNSVASSTGIVLLKQTGALTPGDLRQLSLKVTEVAHVATDFPKPLGMAEGEGGVASFCSYNASCIVNNSCTSNPAVNDAESAVAKMRWISGAFIYICSGGLIADTDASTTIPYFLTANHCISRNKDAKSLECYFQYSVSCGTSVCAGSFSPAPAPSTLGASVVAHGSSGDFSLLRLNQSPPSGSVFLGWNNSPIANTNNADLYRVSHPSGAPQAFSHHTVDTGAVTCQGWPRGERIYSNDVTGATEGGSSGSPVVNSAGQVVGQLSGCCGYNCADVCDTASNSTVDGAFAYYWPSVQPYLDPQGGGGGCSTNDECDDGLFCNGAETCSAGTCQAGSDPCPGQGCNESTNSCVSCGGNGASCSSNGDCCSNNCRNGTCRGN